MSDITFPTVAERSVGVTPFSACQYVDVNKSVRLWYVPAEEGGGFQFACGQFYSAAYADATMCDPDTEVEILFHGVAYFDGIRHLYFGDDSGGDDDLYYAKVEELILALAALRLLERQLCCDAQR